MRSGGLNANYNTGEGDITLSPKFMEQDALFRADVLRDWIYDLTQLYEEARSNIFKK